MSIDSKEDFINEIYKKLASGKQLNYLELNTVITALRKYTDTPPQEPYYEVIYHDEYDNTQRRIMEPISSRECEDWLDPNVKIREDHFDLRFRRLIKKEDKE